MSLRSNKKNWVSKVGNFIKNIGWWTAKLWSAIAAGSFALATLFGWPVGAAGAWWLSLWLNSALLWWWIWLTGKVINSTQQALIKNNS